MRSDEHQPLRERVMIRFILIAISTTIFVADPVAQAAEDGVPQKQEPKTYEKCILAASERNYKWTQYRVDVNKCRAEFNIPGKY